jgi:hypothetical protein
VVLGAVYAIAILLLAVGGWTPGSAPLLPLARSTYFYVESLFTVPVIISAGLLAACTAHAVAGWLGARTVRGDLVVTIARATWMATLCSLVPDLLMGLTTTLGMFDGAEVARDLVRPSPLRIVLWTYLALYALAFLVLYPVAVRAATGLDAVRSLIAGWCAFAVYQGVLAIFIR